MADRPIPSEFEYLFRPERVGSEDSTLKIPQVSTTFDTQEIRGGTQQLPRVDVTTEQPVVPPPANRYIAPMPRSEPDHQAGPQPSNGLLGIAFCLAIGLFVAAYLLHNYRFETPSQDKPRVQRSTAAPKASPTQQQESSVNTAEPAPSRSPVITIPRKSPTNTPSDLSTASAASSAKTEPSLTATAAPSVAPTVVETPPPATPTAPPSEPASPTPSEQPSTPATTITP